MIFYVTRHEKTMEKIKNKAELLLALLFAGEGNEKGKNQTPTSVTGITRLEKLIFLLKHQEGFLSNVAPKDDYNFVPFRMGPWSNEVYDEVDFLESLGLLKKRETKGQESEDAVHNYELFNSLIVEKYQKNAVNTDENTEIFSLTDKGKEKAVDIWNKLNPEERGKIVILKKKFNGMNLKQFLRYVYKKFPEYASESEIKEYLNI